MLFPARHRFHPRSQQDRDHDRRDAALRAQVAAESERIDELERQQQIQLKRIAQLQAQLDEALKLIHLNKR